VVKTKFDALVKLKKLEVDKVSREIVKQNGKIAKATEELEKLEKEFREMEYPKSGNFSLITQFKIIQNALLEQINSKKEEIKFLEGQKKILSAQLKDKEIEYEKMKYLQGEEIKKIIQKMKKEEAKNMDEIALMLFKGQNK
jgi:flagellar biosynthesis chaperone FliJ